jgi:hypothetical protein
MIDVGKKMPANKLDGLPIEVQMVAETIIDASAQRSASRSDEGKSKPIPAAALAEFPGLAERLAKVDAGFVVAASVDEDITPGLMESATGTGIDAFPWLKNAVEPPVELPCPDPEPEPEPDGPVIPTVLYEYNPETDPITLPFPEPDPADALVAKIVTKYGNKVQEGYEPPPVDDYSEDVLADDGSEDLEEEEEAADNGFFEDDEPEPVDEEEQKYLAMLTPEVMERMLANMRANGIIP